MSKHQSKSKNEPPAVRFQGARAEDFLILSRFFAQDERISFEALGLVVYLLSKPPNWKIRQSDLVRRSGKSAYAVRKILNELKEMYYARIEYIMGEDGQMKGREWVLYGNPKDNPDYQRDQLLKAQTKLDLQLDSSTPQADEPITLEKLYELWQEKRPRQAVERQFVKLTEQDKREIAAHVFKYCEFNPDIRYRKKLERYLDPVQKNWQEPLIDRRHAKQGNQNHRRSQQRGGGSRHIATGTGGNKDYGLT